MNNVNLTGRIASIVSSEKCTIFTVAAKRHRSTDYTDFVDCIAFNSTSDFIQRNFEIGKPIEIEGYISKSKHNDEYHTRVIVESAGFCGAKIPQSTDEVSAQPED